MSNRRTVTRDRAGDLLAGLAAFVCRSSCSNYRVFQFNLVVVYAIALLGLNMLTGFNGQISLGHGAFYAIGAYVAAILMDRSACPIGRRCRSPAPVLRVRLPDGFSGVAAGGPLPRGGHVRARAGDPQLLKYKHLEHYTGGVQGIVWSSRSRLTFRLDAVQPDRWLYFFTLAVTIVMFVLAWNLLRGRVGRAMIAIRDHPIAAAAMGINSMFKSLTFGVSAAVHRRCRRAGCGGHAFVAPDSFTVALSIYLLVGVVVGGLALIPGAFFGACSSNSCRISPTRFEGRTVADLRSVPARVIYLMPPAWRASLRVVRAAVAAGLTKAF